MNQLFKLLSDLNIADNYTLILGEYDITKRYTLRGSVIYTIYEHICRAESSRLRTTMTVAENGIVFNNDIGPIRDVFNDTNTTRIYNELCLFGLPHLYFN